MDDPRQSVLIVDDDKAVREILTAQLEQWKPTEDAIDDRRFEVFHATSGEKALEFLSDAFADVVLADLRMPGMDGLELLERIGRDHPGTPVVMLTAHASIPIAVQAMRIGAADFVEKPWNFEELVASLKKAINTAPPDGRDSRAHSRQTRAILEQLPTMEKALEAVRRASQGMSTVLIRGESGTGKNVAARTLHDLSPRKSAPFITVQCTGIPDQLLESELFGHEPHSFTGAGPKRKEGRVTWAQGGTLFLDEIGDVPMHLQVKLLQLVSPEHRYTRIGGDRELTADVRVVAATHRNLEKMVKEETFRKDLFYRLNVIQIRIPPLRERKGEIEQLALQFLERFATENLRPGLHFSREAMELIRNFEWPGNIRQLENVVEGLAVMSAEETISLPEVRDALSDASSNEPTGGADAAQGDTLEEQLRSVERSFLSNALRKAAGNKALAARLLKISRRSIYNKLKDHGLEQWKPPLG
jgi:DNA-binding NtrC family response regulator